MTLPNSIIIPHRARILRDIREQSAQQGVQLCETLKEFGRHHFSLSATYAQVVGSERVTTYTVNRAAYSVYLRLYHDSLERSFWGQLLWPKNTIVIANINFRDTRRGHGADFLRYLGRYAKSQNLDFIGIECAGPSLSQFAEKHRFLKFGDERTMLRNFIITPAALNNLPFLGSGN